VIPGCLDCSFATYSFKKPLKPRELIVFLVISYAKFSTGLVDLWIAHLLLFQKNTNTSRISGFLVISL